MARSRKGFGWRPSPEDKRDLTERDALAGIVSGDVERSDLSAHEPAEPLIQWQSNTCVAQMLSAAIVACESQAGLPKNPPSRRQIYYNAVRKVTPWFLPIRDVGCVPRVAATMLQRLGACSEFESVPGEVTMPFSASYSKIRRRPNFDQAQAAHSRAGGSYFRIASTGQARARAVRQVLGLGLPVGFATPVDDVFLANSGDEVVGPQMLDRVVGNHMMLINGHRPASEVSLLAASRGDFVYRDLNWWAGWRDDRHVWITEDFLTAPTTRDLIVVIGWEVIRRRFDANPTLAKWREVTAQLDEARLALS